MLEVFLRFDLNQSSHKNLSLCQTILEIQFSSRYIVCITMIPLYFPNKYLRKTKEYLDHISIYQKIIKG